MKDFRISEHFSFLELCPTRDHPELLTENREWFSKEPYLGRLTYAAEYLLENIRDDVRLPIVVTSGGRCPKLNKAVGGVKTSQHLFENHLDGAYDFYVVGQGVEKTAEIIYFSGLTFFQMRVYTKSNFLHVGMARPQNNLSVWWDAPDKPTWARGMR
jgi:hypothetical protein